ncbi:MAG TPA: hypothetical protein V6C72_19805 [Chroococcales cyanobacterium]
MSTMNNHVNTAAAQASQVPAEILLSSDAERDQRVMKTFIAMIFVGAVCGAGAGFTYAESVPGMELASCLLSALSYGTFGAAMGMLVAGYFDILAHGTLEDDEQ